MANLLFYVQLFVTIYMTGVVWFVQIVQYPMMGRIPADMFVDYENEYTSRMGLVVAAPMLIEMATAFAMLFLLPTGMPRSAAWVGFALMLVVAGVTFAWFVPAHATLSQGFDADLHRRLVSYNWVRTIGWTTRAVLLTWLAWRL